MAHTPSFGAEALSRQVPAEHISPPGHHSTTTFLTLALKPTSIILLKWVSCPQLEDAVGFLCSPLFGMSLYLTLVTPSLHGCVGFPLAVLSGGYSLVAVQSPHCGGFSCGAPSRALRLQQLRLLGSRVWLQQLWCAGSAAPRPVGSSRTTGGTCVPCTGGWILYQ